MKEKVDTVVRTYYTKL